MKCPFCKKSRTQVIDSRTSDKGSTIRRRRQCMKCKRRFTTYERPEGKIVHVVKRDGTKEIFDRDKLRGSINIACNKRPVADKQIDVVVDKVEREVFKSHSPEVSSRVIGDLVLQQLKRIDKVAYVRFASVYRSFSDVEQFIEESKAVKKK